MGRKTYILGVVVVAVKLRPKLFDRDEKILILLKFGKTGHSLSFGLTKSQRWPGKVQFQVQGSKAVSPGVGIYHC